MFASHRGLFSPLILAGDFGRIASRQWRGRSEAFSQDVDSAAVYRNGPDRGVIPRHVKSRSLSKGIANDPPSAPPPGRHCGGGGRHSNLRYRNIRSALASSPRSGCTLARCDRRGRYRPIVDIHFCGLLHGAGRRLTLRLGQALAHPRCVDLRGSAVTPSRAPTNLHRWSVTFFVLKVLPTLGTMPLASPRSLVCVANLAASVVTILIRPTFVRSPAYDR